MGDVFGDIYAKHLRIGDHGCSDSLPINLIKIRFRDDLLL